MTPSPRPPSPLLAVIDRTFDTHGDRYSCAAALREAIGAAREAAFSGLAAPGGGRRTCAAHALVVDHLVRRAYAFVARYAGADRDPGRLPVSVVATGGYGRRELGPHSSVEVVVLHPGTDPSEYARVAVEALFPFLVDAGLPVRHRVASHDEVRGAMVADPEAAAALLDARFVTGDRSVWSAFRREVAAPFLADEGPRLIERWVQALRSRHAEFGTGGLGKEPDLMRSPGGLLDLRVLASIDRAARAAVRSERGVAHPFDAGEVKERLRALAVAGDALLQVRAALHLEAGEPEDRLVLDRWTAVHARLEPEPDGAGPLLPVEAFLQRLRRQGAVVSGALERLLAVVAREARLVEASGPRSEPGLEASERLSRRAAPALRDDRAAWRTLREVFGAPGRTAPGLRALAARGVLQAMVPEYDAVVGLARLEPRHAYTVDEHLLRAVAVADALEEEDDALPEELRALARRIPDLSVLKVASFVHDLGKARGSGHAAAGEALARPLLRRLGYDDARAAEVAFLVREHRAMSPFGRPLDPRDDAALDELVGAVGTVDRLRTLYLLTVCDLKATSPTAYARWPAELLRDLWQRAVRRLGETKGAPDEQTGGATDAKRDHLARMPSRYRAEVGDAEVGVHLDLARRVASGDVAALAWAERGAGGTLWIVTDDRPRLLADLCGALGMAGFPIAAADAFPRADGVAFDRFRLAGDPSVAVDLGGLRESVKGVLRGELEPGPALGPGDRARVPPGEVVVRLESAGRTLTATVEAPDRPGVLFAVAREVAAVGLDVARATVVTRSGRVELSFEVPGVGPSALADGRLERLRGRLAAAARGEGGAVDGGRTQSSKRKSSP